MTPTQIQEIIALIEKDGLEHTFMVKSDFDHINDRCFHRHKNAFIKAYSLFESYLHLLNDLDGCAQEVILRTDLSQIGIFIKYINENVCICAFPNTNYTPTEYKNCDIIFIP